MAHPLPRGGPLPIAGCHIHTSCRVLARLIPWVSCREPTVGRKKAERINGRQAVPCDSFDNWNAVDHGTRFHRRHQADIGLRCEGVDGGINIVGVANANRDWLYRRRTGDNFERVKKEFTRCGDLWSAEDKGHRRH
jgi:hypothetical protein